MNWITIAWPMVASACITLGLINLACLVVAPVATHAQPSNAAETNARAIGRHMSLEFTTPPELPRCGGK